MAHTLSAIETQHQDIDAMFKQVSDPDTDHRDVLSRLTTQLAAHVSVEHSVLYPAIKRNGIGGRELPRGLKRDYRQIQHLLIVIERRKINSPDLPKLLTELKDVFQGHVRRCKALAGIENRMSPEELEDLTQRLDRGEDVILSHPHPHLLSLGALSRLTTRIASRFDRTRDRTVSNLP